MNSDDHKSVSDDSNLNPDFDLDNVEISDIPLTEDDGVVYQSGISSKIIKLGRHIPKQRRTWRWLMGAAICSLLLGLLFSNLSALKASVLNLLPAPSPAPLSSNSIIMLDTTPGPQSIIGVDPNAKPTGRYVNGPSIAAPAPQDCVAVPKVASSREIGSAPVWLYGFDGPRATIHLRGFSQPIVHNVYGWPVLIQVMVKDNFTLPVTLSSGSQGRNSLRDGPAIFFAFDPGERPMDSIILGTQQSVVNPIQPEVGQRAVWIATMFLFGSGCYTLKASWPGGQWSINFTAGR